MSDLLPASNRYDRILSTDELDVCSISEGTVAANDPWRQPIRYAVDGDGVVSLNGIRVDQPVIAWSCGANRLDEGGAGDDIVSWRE